MNFVGQGILDLSRIRPTHCVFSALVKASVTHLSIEFDTSLISYYAIAK